MKTNRMWMKRAAMLSAMAACALGAQSAFSAKDDAATGADVHLEDAASFRPTPMPRVKATPKTSADTYEATGDLGIIMEHGQTITLHFDIDKAYTRITSARLVMYMWDVDYPCATEQDNVYFNGTYLGRLEGLNNGWDYNYFNVPISKITVPSSGGGVSRNTVTIKVSVDPSGWITQCGSAQLIINGDTFSLTASRNIVGGISVNWDDLYGSYDLYRKGPDDSIFTRIRPNITTNGYFDTDVQIGKPYTYYAIQSGAKSGGAKDATPNGASNTDEGLAGATDKPIITDVEFASPIVLSAYERALNTFNTSARFDVWITFDKVESYDVSKFKLKVMGTRIRPGNQTIECSDFEIENGIQLSKNQCRCRFVTYAKNFSPKLGVEHRGFYKFTFAVEPNGGDKFDMASGKTIEGLIYFNREDEVDVGGDKWPAWARFWQKDGAFAKVAGNDYKFKNMDSFGMSDKEEIFVSKYAIKKKNYKMTVYRYDDTQKKWPEEIQGSELEADQINKDAVEDVAVTLAHESKHRDIYRTFYLGKGDYGNQFKFDENSSLANHRNSDYEEKWFRNWDDSLTDGYEEHLNDKYSCHLDKNNVDTYDIGARYNKNYKAYGDNEFLARKAGLEQMNKAHCGVITERDYAYPGLQMEQWQTKGTKGMLARVTAKGVNKGMDDEGVGGVLSEWPVFDEDVLKNTHILFVSNDRGEVINSSQTDGASALRFNVRITCNTNEWQGITNHSFEVRGYLADKNGSPVAWTVSDITFTNKSVDVALDFAGEYIHAHRGSGYSLKYVSLALTGIDIDMVAAVGVDVASTAEDISADAFAGKHFFVTDFHENVADKSLKVHFNAEVKESGVYTFKGHLAKSGTSETVADTVTVVTNLTSGATIFPVELSFPGQQIYLSGMDGAYSLSFLTVSRDDAAITAKCDVYDLMNEYNHLDFKVLVSSLSLVDGSASFGTPATASDGFLGALPFSVAINNSGSSGKFHVTAILEEAYSNKQYVASYVGQKEFTNGFNQVSLSFSSGDITASGIDGPYSVRNIRIQSVSDPSVVEVFRPDVVTGEYKADDFGKTPVELVGTPVVNTSGSAPVVTLMVEGLRDCVYNASAVLLDSNREFVAYVVTTNTIAAGVTNTVTLAFDESVIIASGHRGPYILDYVMLEPQNGADAAKLYSGAAVSDIDYTVADAYVDAVNGSDSNGGTSWSDAYQTIQAAVNVSMSGDTILVADGTYAPFQTGNKELTIQSRNGPAYAIIDGGGTNRCATLGTSVGQTNTVLRGFTLRNGNARNAQTFPRYGGGVLFGTVENCHIYGNRADSSLDWGSRGGGSYASNLKNCHVAGNMACTGGGTYIPAATVFVEDCVFAFNKAEDGSAIVASSGSQGTPILKRNLVYENSVSTWGAFYDPAGSGLGLTQCTIADNTSDTRTGGVSSGFSTDSIIWGNKHGDMDANFTSWGASFANCCTTPLPTGNSNISDNPQFVDPEHHVYLLRSSSPCIGTASDGGNMGACGIAPEGGFVVGTATDGYGLILEPGTVVEAGGSASFTAAEIGREFQHFTTNGVFATTNRVIELSDIRSDVLVTAVFAKREFFVAAVSGDDANDGLSTAKSKKTIDSAVKDAVDFDTVTVARGTYAPVTSLGAKKILVRSQRGASSTIIDGGGTNRCATLGAGTILRGFTLQNGDARMAGTLAPYGGGVCGGTVENCLIYNNTGMAWPGGGEQGGGVYASVLNDCTLTGNWTVHSEGDVFSDSLYFWRFDKDINEDGKVQAGEVRDVRYWGRANMYGYAGSVAAAGMAGPYGGPLWTNMNVYLPGRGVTIQSPCMYFPVVTNHYVNGSGETIYRARTTVCVVAPGASRSGSMTILARVYPLLNVGAEAKVCRVIYNNGQDWPSFSGCTAGIHGGPDTSGKTFFPYIVLARNWYYATGLKMTTNTWYDIAYSVMDGGKDANGEELPDKLIVAVSDEEKGFRTQVLDVSTNAYTTYAASARNVTIGGGSASALNDYFNATTGTQVSDGNAVKSFNGMIHQVVYWNRALTADEIAEAFGHPNTMIMGVGTEDGASGEFGTIDEGSHDWTVGEAWHEMAGSVDSAHPKLTLRFSAESNSFSLAQSLCVKVAQAGSAGQTARLGMALNGRHVSVREVASGENVRYFIPANHLVAERNSLTLSYEGGSAPSVSFDKIEIGGSWQLGVNDGTYSGFSQEGGGRSSDYYVGNRNLTNVIRAATINLKNMNANFFVPDELAKNRQFSFTAGSLSTINGTRNSFRILLNGIEKYATPAAGLAGGSEVGFDVLPGELLPGWNSIRTQFTGTESWMTYDYMRLGMHELPSDAATSWHNICHVAPDGSDSADGYTESSAFRTIQRAVDAVSDGDEIVVADGIYPPFSSFNKRITIKSANGPAYAIIDGGGTNRCAMLGTSVGQTNTVLRGFTLRNGNASGNAVTVLRNYGGGVCCGTVESCHVYRNSANTGGGAYASQLKECIISFNVVTGNGGGVWLPNMPNMQWGINGCFFMYNSAGNFGSAAYVANQEGTTPPVFHDCLFAENQTSYLYVVYGSARDGGIETSILVNCTVIRNVSYSSYAGLCSVTASDSIMWENRSLSGSLVNYRSPYMTILNSCTSPLPSGSGNISDDPQFVDPKHHVYLLRPGSPCIGTASGGGNMGACGVAPEGGFVVGTATDGYGLILEPGTVVEAGGSASFTAAEIGREFQHFTTNGVFATTNRVIELSDIRSDVLVTAVFARHEFFVAAGGGNDANDGLSTAKAKKTIESAVKDAVDYDTVTVARGTYAPITALGAKRILVRSQRGASSTIIDGGRTNRCITCLENGSASTNAVIVGFTLRNGYATAQGGGAVGGTLRNCFIEDCVAETDGGGTCQSSLENCVVARNKAGTYGGGTYYGVVDHCTICGNEAGISGGGTYSGTIYNCIVSKNVVGGNEANWSNGAFDSCCTYPNRGSNPVVGDPMLVDGWNGDARLRVGSPCIVNGVQVCGANVGAPVQGVSVSVGVQGTGAVSNETILVTSGGTATIEALETVRPFLYWNINGEHVTNRVYTLTNVTADIRAVAVFGSFDWHVDVDYGDDANDGSDWDTAKRTLQAAVVAAVDDETIYVEAGTYEPISTGNKHIRIESMNGAEMTFIDGGGTNRCATLGTNGTHTNSVLVGFTLLNGRAPQSGNYAYGGGSYYGTLEYCIISNCVANGYYAYGGGAYYGTLDNCLVAYNCATSSSYRACGGGTYGSALRSCTVARNCAVGSNAAYYGGAYGDWKSAYNSIIWDNEVKSSNASSVYYPNTYATYLYYCCTDGTVSYRQSGCVTSDPRFVDADAGDFHLKAGSPCLNAGYNDDVQGDMDLDWDDRIQGAKVDMGCYEGAEYAEPPGQVTGLRASRGVLTWDAMPDAEGFMVYRSTRRAASSAKYIGLSDTNTYVDETAAEGTTYYYWVVAFNTLGTGTRSELAEGVWPEPLVITTTGLPDSRVHDGYSVQLQATGGVVPYRWDAVMPDYAVSSNASTFAITGAAQGWTSDDSSWSYNLPFNFPFYGQTYNSVYVNDNGSLSFGRGISHYYYREDTFNSTPMIAVLWADLIANPGDVYVSTTENAVTFRWLRRYYGDGTLECNFSASLHADGRIVLSYGDGNANGGMCGISAGDGVRGIIARNNSTSWSNVKDIVFADGGYVASPERLPDGLMLSEDGVLSGVATKDGSYAFYVRVTDAMGDSQVAEFQLEVEKNPIVLHVDATSGDDANGGLSMESAKRSLQRAIDSALDDDAILVAPGVYAPISTGNKRIRIESVNGAEMTFIDGGGTNRCATLGTNGTHTNSVLVGFTLLNGRAPQSGNYAYGGGSYYGTLEYCIISNCVANGYYAYGGGAYYGNLNNCLVAYNCATSSSYRAYGGGMYGSYLRSTTIARNRAIGMNAAYYGGAYGDWKSAYNSIIWDNEVKSSNASSVYYPNTYATYLYYCCTDGTVSYRQSGCVTNDPQFVDADAGDFRLSVGSPCIDAGDNSYALEDKDLNGNARIAEVAVDMGCYEGAVYNAQPGLVTGEPLAIATTMLQDAMETVEYSAQLDAVGGVEPYFWEAVAKGYAYSRADNSFANGGEAQEWGSYWTTKCYALPFGFTFYGKTYDEVYVNENGTISFGKSFTTTSPTSWENYLDNVPFVAPEWDWTTSSSNKVYVSATADAIMFGWDVESVYGDCRCAFSVTLQRDGTIRFSYGEGKSSSSFAGVSAGDGVRYTVVATRQSGGIGNWARDVVLRPCYVASTVEMPDGLVLDSSGLLHGTMTMAWTNSIAVRVRDAAGAILVRELPFTITANPNRRPVIENVTPTNAVTFVKVGDSRMFSIVASDPEGTPLSYRWTMDGNSIAGADTSEYTFSPAAEDAGRVRTLTCYVSDDLWSDMVLTNWTVKVPRTIYVDAASTNDEWDVDGSSPESAYLSLSRALDYAEVGDTILVAPGVYDEYLDFRSYGIGYGEPDAFITIRSIEGASSTVLTGTLRNYNSNGWQREDWAWYYDGRYYEQTPLSVLEGFTLRCPEVENLSLVNCIVKDVDDGTGMYGLSGCCLTNCIVTDCHSLNTLLRSCELTRCTVAGNLLQGDGAFAIGEGSLVMDSIVYGNMTDAGAVANYDPEVREYLEYTYTEEGQQEHLVNIPYAMFTNSCTCPLPTMVGSEGNIADDPLLVDASNGDLRLRVGSPCIVDGVQTMGAYLGEPVSGLVLSVRIEGNGAVSPMTAIVANGGNAVFEVTDSPRPFIGFSTNGVFATAADTLTWQGVAADGVVTAVFSNLTFYVDAATGSDANDGLSWATAKASIQAAVGEALDGEVVYVKAGTYRPINSNGKRICIESVDGKSVTIIDGGGTNRCATLGSTTNTLVRGFTLTNGKADNGGAAYYGTLEDSDIVGNGATTCGGGLCYSAAIRCRIMDNMVQGSYYWYAYGGGAYYGMLRNCLVVGNAANCSDRGNGGGTYYCTHYNCTIVSNSVSGTSCQGGGAYGGTLYNTIVYGNLAANVPNEVNGVSAYNSLVGIDPLFVDSDYRTAVGSPCIDSGRNSYVMDDIDLDGNARLQHYTVDIGCYEYELVTPERDTRADFAAQMAGTCYGVFVGVGRYTYTSSLTGPTSDATNMQTRCITNGYWHDTNTVALLDAAATKNAVRAQLFSLAAKAVSGDMVLYYQSSHGGSHASGGNYTKDTYICLHDETYEDYEMASDLMQFAAGVKVIIVLDTCHSAGMFKAMGEPSHMPGNSFALRVRELIEEKDSLRKGAKSGIAVDDIGWIAAADYNQYSWDGPTGGKFTSAMLDGWKTGAADYDGDKRLNFHELWRYAKGIAVGYGGSEASDAQCLNESVLLSRFAGTPDSSGAGNMTETTPVPVEHIWLDTYPEVLATFDGDYEAMGNAQSPGASGSGKIWSDGSPCYVWQDFVAGTSPTNDTVFTAIIRMEGNTPVITWEPDTPELRATRVYRTLGKKTLLDTKWTDITDKDQSEYHFFKITVQMP